MKREQFLRKTCPAFMLTILASSEFLTACKGSAEGEISPASSTPQPVTTQEEKDYLARKKPSARRVIYRKIQWSMSTLRMPHMPLY